MSLYEPHKRYGNSYACHVMRKRERVTQWFGSKAVGGFRFMLGMAGGEEVAAEDEGRDQWCGNSTLKDIPK
jgi:hypothetical protein